MLNHTKIVLAVIIASAPVAVGAIGILDTRIPDMRVGPFNFDDVPFHVALGEIVRGTGVSVIMQDDIPGTLSAEGVTGKLDTVVGKLCGYSGAKCVFQNGAIVVSLRSKYDLTPTAALLDAPPPAAAPIMWQLKAGLPIHTQIESWAKQAGWTFSWKAKKSWVVPANTEFGGEFDAAVEAVVKTLYQQGKPLTLKIWEGNKVAEVIDGSV